MNEPSLVPDKNTATLSHLSEGDGFIQRKNRAAKGELWPELASCSTSAARAVLPLELARRYQVLPLAVYSSNEGRRLLSLVASDTSSASLRKEIGFITNCDVEFETACPRDVERAILAAYQGGEESLRFAVQQAAEVRGSLEKNPSVEGLNLASGQPVPLLLDALLNRAIALSASDIHLEPGSRRHRVRFRIDGSLRPLDEFQASPATAGDLCRRIKVLSKLDTTVVGRPQEGGFSFDTAQWSLRIRVSIIPQLQGEKVVLRILDNAFLDTLLAQGGSETVFSRLGMSSTGERVFLSCLTAESGTILLSGPTGSGKSTLLYAALGFLNESRRSIVTIEDPVERLLAGVSQVEVNRAGGLDYADLLPAILRQDPDVLMLGEIRDATTAETALTAGITGHLVLSTVHAGDCIEVLGRMSQFRIPPDLLSMSLRLIVAQRLVPKNCPHCVSSGEADPMLTRCFKFEDDVKVYSSSGCSKCGFTGVVGRTAVFEVLPLSGPFAELLTPAATAAGSWNLRSRAELRTIAERSGFRPFIHEVRELLLTGMISPRAAFNALGLRAELLGYC